MYRDKKTPIKRVRSMGRQTFSNPKALVKRNVDAISPLMNSDRAGLSAKHPLSNVARLLAGVRILANEVYRLLDFAQPEFDGHFLVFPANAEFQQVAGFLLLQPAIGPPGRFSAVPTEDDIASPQSRQGRRTFGINLPYYRRSIRFALHRKTKRGLSLLHAPQSQ